VARTTHKFGWVPDLPDHRDLSLVHKLTAAPLPPAFSLIAGMPAIYDQLNEGSCVANATAAAIDYERKRQGLRFMIPSRQFIYWNARDLEQSTDSDSGCMIRDAIKSVVSQGVCVEGFWPYSEDLTVKPNALSYSTAIRHETLQYLSPVQDLTNLKAGLQLGYPFVFGFSVYSSFMSDQVASTGIVPMPAPSEGQIGGHAVAAVGYDDTTGESTVPLPRPPVPSFLCRNSWNTTWGMGGYFWIPYQYVLDPNLSDDFLSIRME
jgi:C1A family cysteine protease